MIKRIFKKTPIIIITAILLSIPINTIYAYTFNVEFADTGSSSSSSGKPGENGSSGNQEPKYSKELSSKTSEENGYKYKETYTCKYNYNISSTNKVTINGYNMQNKKIIENSLKISDKNKIVAGTSIGLEIYEVKKISYRVSDIEVVYTKVKTEKKETKCQAYTCNYSCTAKGSSPYTVQKSVSAGYACSKGNQKSTMHSCVNTTSSPTCSSYKIGWVDTNETITKRTYTSESNNYVKDCLKHAVKVAKEKANATGTSATYSIKVPESNNINKTSITTIQGNGTSEEKFNVNENKEQKSGTRKVEYEYSTNPCMNVITSEVRYVSNIDSCKSEKNEILIANDNINGKSHWHYFVPLNTKSKDKEGNNNTVNIALTKNQKNNILDFKQCIYVLENKYVEKDSNKTDYTDLIKLGNGESLEGDYICKLKNGKKKCDKKLESTNDYSKLKKHKCYLTSVIKIPITQQFYKEKETTKNNKTTITFTGFKFYYRSVNINDPFPNGIKNTTSAWYEWYKKYKNNDKKLSPNIEQSYKKVSYQALSINTSRVRKYNENNIYSNWNGMTKDGKSSFITKEGIVTRKTTGEIFKIGGGPGVKFTKKGNVITVKTGGTS